MVKSFSPGPADPVGAEPGLGLVVGTSTPSASRSAHFISPDRISPVPHAEGAGGRVERSSPGRRLVVGHRIPQVGPRLEGMSDTCLLYTSPSPRDRTRSR